MINLNFYEIEENSEESNMEKKKKQKKKIMIKPKNVYRKLLSFRGRGGGEATKKTFFCGMVLFSSSVISN